MASKIIICVGRVFVAFRRRGCFAPNTMLSSVVWLAFILHALIATTHHLAYASSAAGTETLIGIVGPDFIILGADSSVSQSIALTASNLDKIAIIVDPVQHHSDDGHNRTASAAAVPAGEEEGKEIRRETLGERRFQQQTIAVSVAGDAADADRLLGILRAHAAIREYEAGVGCDVEFFDCAGDNSGNEIATTEDHAIQRCVVSPPGLSVDAVANLARRLVAERLRSRSPFKVCLLVGGMMLATTDERRGKDSPDGKSPTTFLSQQVQRQVAAAFVPSDRAQQPTTSSASVDESIRDINRDNGDDDTYTSTGSKESSAPARHLSTSTGPQHTLQPCLYWLDEYGSLQQVQYGAHGLGSYFILSILDQGYRPDLTREEAAALMLRCFRQLRTRYVINSPKPPCIKCIDAHGSRLLQ